MAALTEADRQGFLAEGYIIIPGVVPPEALPALRRQCETLVERQRALWAAAAQGVGASDDPRQGTTTRGTVSGQGAQPRLFISYPPLCQQIDAETSGCVDVWMPGGTMHTACSFLLGVDDAALTEIFLMCSPEEDHNDLRDWLGWREYSTNQPLLAIYGCTHFDSLLVVADRDFSPSNGVPLQALVENMIENNPRYVQLNLPLYDDEVLVRTRRITVGSIKRRNVLAIV